MSDDTLSRVQKCVAEVLALDPKDIDPGASLMDDLGAESLDLVELMYLLEQEFKIRLSQQDMSLSAQLGLPEEQIHDHEVLTDQALELLRERFSGSSAMLKQGITRKQLAGLLTVQEVVRSIDRKLSSGSSNG